MSNKWNVVIGRFSGFHAGHEYLIETALSLGGKVIILLGSANKPRTIKNPWTWKERATKILKKFPEAIIAPINDYKYNDEHWVNDVNFTVNHLVLANGGTSTDQTTLVGHEKEDTTYLSWFPNWRSYTARNTIIASGTITRKWLFENNPTIFPAELQEDYLYFKNEAEKFASYPFPETLNFSCADSVVECAGHILLIQRIAAPGRNTWAVPGGFKNSNETFIECALRELREETNLRVTEKVLRGSIVREKLYDSPDRGCGIPRITKAFYFKIEKDRDGGLPRANAKSDAKQAKWVPISTVLSEYKLFDDHLDIISDLTGAKPISAILNPNV